MSYDKWDDSLDEDQKSTRRNSGKKWGYLHNFTDAPTRVHLSRPEKPYVHPKTGRQFQFRTSKRHWLPGRGKRGRGVFMECGVDFGDPCVTCAYSNPDAFELEGVKYDASLAQHDARTYYTVAGWIEEDYHVVEYLKDEKNESAGTFHRREPCLGRGCEFCEDNCLDVFGKKFYSEFSPGQWKHSIHALNTKIMNRWCRCGGDIFVTSFCCAKCEDLVLDVSTCCPKCDSDDVFIDVDKQKARCDSCKHNWSAFYTDHKTVYEESRERYKCKCGHRGFLAAQRICSEEKCDVDPYDVFDCQLVIKVTGKGKDKRTTIEEYEIQEPDERLFDEAAQGGDEWATKVVQSFKKSLDLDYLLRPGSPEEQAKDIGKANPFSTAAKGGNRFARYDNDGNDDVEGDGDDADSDE